MNKLNMNHSINALDLFRGIIIADLSKWIGTLIIKSN